MITGLALAGTLLLFAAEGRLKRLHKTAVRTVDFTEVILPVNKQTAVKKIAAISYGIAGINRGVTLGGKFANFWLSDSPRVHFPPGRLSASRKLKRQSCPSALLATEPWISEGRFLFKSSNRFLLALIRVHLSRKTGAIYVQFHHSPWRYGKFNNQARGYRGFALRKDGQKIWMVRAHWSVSSVFLWHTPSSTYDGRSAGTLGSTRTSN